MYGIYTETPHFAQLDAKVRDEHLASGGWDSVEEYASVNIDRSVVFDWKVLLEDNITKVLFDLYDIV